MKRTVDVDGAPGPVGNFSLATTDGDLVFTAGQVPETADGEVLRDASIEEQTRQCLTNLDRVLDAEGLGMDDVLKTTVYVVDPQMWSRVNEAYGEFFDDYPARSVVGVTGLWGGIDVEIEAIAAAP
ncbi:RidA family protein [Haloplanus halophilus]|uniref:RidA family protein n=1 Tax=Haloplanus halophilus TaxID=2949993 RepID=UPI00203E63E9|nr:RidA family protein [Haloplanus sp. GDY1]